MHFIVAFGLTLVALAIYPKKTTAIIILMLFMLFELFEVVFIYNLGNTGLAVNTYETLMFEIGDVIPDIIVDTLGWALALILMKKKIRN